jgi:hypothetical protein
MKKILLAIALLASMTALAEPLHICKGLYAFCGASSTTPTGKDITVLGKTYQEGMSVCPVLKGTSIANFTLMNDSCQAPVGKVWSLFAQLTTVPQAPTWKNLPLVTRTFVTTKEKSGGMSNMWSFLCDIQPMQVNGVTLANCYGPLNESPWTNGPVPAGATIVTQAAAGSSNPVGGRVSAELLPKPQAK